MREALAEARRIDRAMEEVTEGAEEPMTVDPHPDRTRRFTSMSFTRMRTNWTREEEGVIEQARIQAQDELMVSFADAYRILSNLYDVVREQDVDEGTGEVLLDEHGYPKWKRDHTGMPLEDWNLLTERDKENFLHQITTRLFFWEQRAADFWGEAMFAKAAWEERFALSFTDAPLVESKRPTEADRTQFAQAESREQRYLAIYMSVRSKKAEALVRSMTLLSQRLKDTSR